LEKQFALQTEFLNLKIKDSCYYRITKQISNLEITNNN
jgi:hypothetical protein